MLTQIQQRCVASQSKGVKHNNDSLGKKKLFNNFKFIFNFNFIFFNDLVHGSSVTFRA